MKPPLTNPPPDLEWGADYDTPQSYARIGRALMLFLFNLSSNPENNERIAWFCEGVAKTNGAKLFDEAAMTVDPSADPSHWMNLARPPGERAPSTTTRNRRTSRARLSYGVAGGAARRTTPPRRKPLAKVPTAPRYPNVNARTESSPMPRRFTA